MNWAEICEDKLLATLPYRIESDRWGHIVMSPPPRSWHAEYQAEIAVLLGTSVGTVKGYLSRGLDRLRPILDRSNRSG